MSGHPHEYTQPCTCPCHYSIASSTKDKAQWLMWFIYSLYLRFRSPCLWRRSALFPLYRPSELFPHTCFIWDFLFLKGSGQLLLIKMAFFVVLALHAAKMKISMLDRLLTSTVLVLAKWLRGWLHGVFFSRVIFLKLGLLLLGVGSSKWSSEASHESRRNVASHKVPFYLLAVPSLLALPAILIAFTSSHT